MVATHDWVIVDCPPTMGINDARLITRASDHTLLQIVQQDILDAMRARDVEATAAAMDVFNQESARYYRRRLRDIISQPVQWQI